MFADRFAMLDGLCNAIAENVKPAKLGSHPFYLS